MLIIKYKKYKKIILLYFQEKKHFKKLFLFQMPLYFIEAVKEGTRLQDQILRPCLENESLEDFALPPEP